MVYLAAYGYSNGNPDYIYRGIDQYQNICGSGTYANYPYLYFYNPVSSLLANTLDNRICVDSCPYWNGTAIKQVGCLTAAQCTYSFTYDSSGVKASGSNTVPSSTDKIGYDTTGILGRICMPSSTMFSVVLNTSSTASSSSFTSLFSSHQNNFISDIKTVIRSLDRTFNGYWRQLGWPWSSLFSSCSSSAVWLAASSGCPSSAQSSSY